MTELEQEIRSLLPLVKSYLETDQGGYTPDAYRAHSKYHLVGNVLAATSVRPRTTHWSSWRAYSTLDYSILYSPELPENKWSVEAVRVLVHEQLQQYSLRGDIETQYGKFYADDGMLMLQSVGKLSAWSIETMDFGTELTPAEIQQHHDYYAELQKDHEDYLVQCAENEYEQRIDRYFSGS